MKCNITLSKLKIIILSSIVFLSVVYCDVKPPKANPYKEEKSVHHSLFREKDSIERMSAYAQSIPQPKKE